MGFLGVAFTFLGYLLVYAATANHGRFAVTPWTSLFADAYDDSGGTTPGNNGSGSSGGSAQSHRSPRRGVIASGRVHAGTVSGVEVPNPATGRETFIPWMK